MKKAKKIVYIVLGTLVLILLIALFASWIKTNDKDATIYKYGRVWNYGVVITNDSGIIVDTFSIKMNTSKPTILERIVGKIVLRYDYSRAGNITQGKRIGITDNDNSIYVPAPDEFSLGYTNIVPNPSFSKQELNKESWKKEKNSGYSKAMNKPSYFDKKQNKKISIDGKKIEYTIETSDTTTLTHRGQDLFCYIQEVKNTNLIEELGQFNGRYYFNEQYGMIKWIYGTPWNETVTITLNETNF